MDTVLAVQYPVIGAVTPIDRIAKTIWINQHDVTKRRQRATTPHGS